MAGIAVTDSRVLRDFRFWEAAYVLWVLRHQAQYPLRMLGAIREQGRAVSDGHRGGAGSHDDGGGGGCVNFVAAFASLLVSRPCPP